MTDATPKRPAGLARFAPLALIAIALALAIVFRVHEGLSLTALYEQRQALDRFIAVNFALALGTYVLAYALLVAISLPGAGFLTIAGGFLFGAWIGGAAAWIGAATGASLIFLAARTALGDALRSRAGSWIERLSEGFRRNAFNYLLVLRLTPVAPFFIVNLVPAFFNVSLRDYVLATLIGMVPGALVYASVGAGLRAALATGAAANPNDAARAILSAPAVYLPILALVALALLPVLIRALRKNSGVRS